MISRVSRQQPTAAEARVEVAYTRLRAIFNAEQAEALATAGMDIVGVLNVSRLVGDAS